MSQNKFNIDIVDLQNKDLVIVILILIDDKC